jgi:hypothetical protein
MRLDELRRLSDLYNPQSNDQTRQNINHAGCESRDGPHTDIQGLGCLQEYRSKGDWVRLARLKTMNKQDERAEMVYIMARMIRYKSSAYTNMILSMRTLFRLVYMESILLFKSALFCRFDHVKSIPPPPIEWDLTSFVPLSP